MNFKHFPLLAAICLCAFLCVSCGPPVTSITVACSSPELIDAINTANDSPTTTTTIHLSPDCVYEFSNIMLYDAGPHPAGVAIPEIISPIIIDGQGATIKRSDAANTMELRLFLVGSLGDLTINEIFLENGKIDSSDGYGGAILNYGTLTITTCDVFNNTAYRGGAIYNEGTFTTLWSVYYDNFAYSSGGAIHNAASMELDRSIFNNNASQVGGAVSNGKAYASVSGCHFTNNSAKNIGPMGYGGAICNSSSNYPAADIGKMHVENSTFDGNEAQTGGAFANLDRSEVLLRECSFDGNSAEYGGALSNQQEMNITRCSITNNTAAYHGGAIYYQDSDASSGLVIGNSTLSGNEVPGGTISHGSVVYQAEGGMGIRYCTIANNSGSPAIYKNNGSTTLSNSIVANNPDGDCGGTAIGSSTSTLGEANLDSDGSCPGFTITANPKLKPLANNGGDTLTHALQIGSPAIDAATEPQITIDQILQVRPYGAANDLGAFEDQGMAAPEDIPPPADIIATVHVPEEPHKEPDYYWWFEGFVCSDMGLTEFYMKTSAIPDNFLTSVNGKNVACYQQSYDTERYWCHVEKQPIGWSIPVEISFCVEGTCTVINRTTLSESKCTSPDAPREPEILDCNTFVTAENCKATPGCSWNCTDTATALLCRCENK